MGEANGVERLIGKAHTAILRGYAFEFYHIATVLNPLLAHARKSFVDVDFYIWVGVGTTRVINHEVVVFNLDAFAIFVFNGRGEFNFSHRHLDWVEHSVEIDFFRRGIRIYFDSVNFHIGDELHS